MVVNRITTMGGRAGGGARSGGGGTARVRRDGSLFTVHYKNMAGAGSDATRNGTMTFRSPKSAQTFAKLIRKGVPEGDIMNPKYYRPGASI